MITETRIRAEELLASAPDGHEYECPVRWADIDAYGHVNNVKYVEYFQEARISFGHELIGVQPDGRLGEFVVVRFDIEYRRPLEFTTAPVRVRTWVTHVGDSSYEMQAAVCEGNVVYAVSRAVVVGFDLDTGRSRSLTSTERQALRGRLT
jgi:acyl-CoA thioester hydrolase